MILAGMAYAITDYRILHAAIALPSLIFLSYWWLVPESARWLVTKERYEEADVILHKAARLNGSYVPDRWPVNTMMYYGLTMKSDLGGGSLYINFAISAAMEIPALFVVYFLIDRIGRRQIVAGSLATAGICLVLNWIIGDDGRFLMLTS
ncbi:hypothetical protein ANCDUO_19665 [Ancylostoma duodenale]|uniref:Major facilitator superfamily (MFS) profile domain-containing protein n=1 Tax=Ancylostoma duodenale TaxID=51022 RepID=A0A0C2FZJ1_9BILA|nr:hypothetical protein ANCDUO_19665 [Ancylostoma duodenale]